LERPHKQRSRKKPKLIYFTMRKKFNFILTIIMLVIFAIINAGKKID